MENNLIKEQYNRRLESQRRFFQAGRTMPQSFRIRQLLRLKKTIEERREIIERALYLDLGKAATEAYFSEIGLVLAVIQDAVKHIPDWSRPKRARTPVYLWPGKSSILYEPYGSVLIIAPFNYPFQLALAPLVGALAAGNCAVVKTSELACHTSKVVKDLLEDLFPPAYVAVAEGDGQVSAELTSCEFQFIFFTGSGRVGKEVMKAAAQNLIPVVLELGGKNPVVVDASAPVGPSVRRILWGKWLNAGQTCIAPDYVLVHESKKDAFLKECRKQLEACFSSSNGKWENGQIINDKHFMRLMNLLEKDKDAIIWRGNMDREERKMDPVLMDGSKSDQLACMEEEIFGPILPVFFYQKTEEALRRIQSMPKPLAFYLFSQSEKAKKFWTKHISAGGICINDTVSHFANSYLPFGGVGPSGMGCYHGKFGFETFSHKKGVMDRGFTPNITIQYPPFTKTKNWLIRKVFR